MHISKKNTAYTWKKVLKMYNAYILNIQFYTWNYIDVLHEFV